MLLHIAPIVLILLQPHRFTTTTLQDLNLHFTVTNIVAGNMIMAGNIGQPDRDWEHIDYILQIWSRITYVISKLEQLQMSVK